MADAFICDAIRTPIGRFGFNPLDKAFTASFEATGTTKRSEFGMTSYLALLGGEVRLTIAGAFVRQP